MTNPSPPNSVDDPYADMLGEITEAQRGQYALTLNRRGTLFRENRPEGGLSTGIFLYEKEIRYAVSQYGGGGTAFMNALSRAIGVRTPGFRVITMEYDETVETNDILVDSTWELSGADDQWTELDDVPDTVARYTLKLVHKDDTFRQGIQVDAEVVVVPN